MARAFPVLLLVLGATCRVGAGEVKTWRQESQKDFVAGTLSRVVVNSDGHVLLSPVISPLADPKATHIWAAVAGPEKTTYFATGNPGSVVSIDASGSLKTVFEAEKEQIFAIAATKEGAILAGLSPSGEVVSISPDGESKVIFRTMEKYVWGLAVDPQGNIYIATGPDGKLFKVDAAGNGDVLFKAKQPHLLSLAVNKEGILFVGTDRDGIVYRITPDGRPYVLLDASQADIQTLYLADDGHLYAGTGTPERPKLTGTGTSRSGSSVQSSGLGSASAETQPTDEQAVATTTGTSRSSSSSTSSGTTSRSSSSSPGQNSVYRIAPDGAVEELFQEKTLVLSLTVRKDKLIVGSGQEGRVYQVDLASRESAELARLEHGQINTLIQSEDGTILLGTGTPGKIYTLDKELSKSGTLLSDVLDTSMQTRWGRTVVQADVPKGTGLTIEVRTGNVSEPDETWTKWQKPSDALPVGRFFQYQATLTTENPEVSPVLRSVAVHYATVNQPPTIESIEVPDLTSSPVEKADAKLKIKWKASDPNSDTLRYKVEIRKEGWPAWVKLADDVDKTEYEFEPGSLPGGDYQVRLSANDANSNRAEDSRTVERISSSFILDRQPPDVEAPTVSFEDGKVKVKCTAKDSQTRLTAAAYSLDGGDWKELFPDDGIFDSLTESVSFELDDVEKGGHLLLIRFRDSAGHNGVADCLVQVP